MALEDHWNDSGKPSPSVSTALASDQILSTDRARFLRPELRAEGRQGRKFGAGAGAGAEPSAS